MEVPKESASDKGHAVVKGLVGAIPIVGSLTAEVVGMIWVKPIERRRDLFLTEIASKLNELESRKLLSIDKLSESDEFATYLTSTYQLFLRNHQEEKVKALLNAIQSYFDGKETDFDRKQVFLQLVDQLTPTHLKTLHALSLYEDEIISNKIMSYEDLVRFLESKGMEINSQMFIKSAKDLEKNYLIRISGDMKEPFSGGGFAVDEGAPPVKVLRFGRDFLEYIKFGI